MNNTAVVIAAILALACTAAHAEDEAATPPPQPLDLRAPDISKLYTHRQLERLIAKIEAEYIEKIEVEGARIPAPEFTPRVWPGIFAPFWAMLNPTQAWRIFAPIPPDQARHIGNQDFSTEGHLEPLGVPPGDPFKE